MPVLINNNVEYLLEDFLLLLFRDDNSILEQQKGCYAQKSHLCISSMA